jgi:CRP-like cAMP-binding protein
MSHAHEVLIRKLESIGQLAENERAAIRNLPIRVSALARGQEAAVDGTTTDECCLLITGFMHRFKLLQDGSRQILAFQTPGDIPDLQSLHLRHMDHTLAATMASTVGFIKHEDVRQLVHRQPGVSDVMWRDTLIDAAIFRNWIAMMGRRSAQQHLAHLFCELFVRMSAIGQVSERGCLLPLTQEDLADALGLSIVHTNRSLQGLREEGLISFERSRLTILDWLGLKDLAQFDATYLHLKDEG